MKQKRQSECSWCEFICGTAAVVLICGVLTVMLCGLVRFGESRTCDSLSYNYRTQMDILNCQIELSNGAWVNVDDFSRDRLLIEQPHFMEKPNPIRWTQ